MPTGVYVCGVYGAYGVCLRLRHFFVLVFLRATFVQLFVIKHFANETFLDLTFFD